MLLPKTYSGKYLGASCRPFPSPPVPNFQVSLIGLVPKKHTAKFRTIFHLSYPKSGKTGINSSISKGDFSLQYTAIDNAIKGIISLGQGCFPAKTDTESAFRLIRLRPSDYELLGCIGRVATTTLTFSLRVNKCPLLVQFIIRCNRMDPPQWVPHFVCLSYPRWLFDHRTSHILTPFQQSRQQSLSSMLLTFTNLGVPIAANKTEGPSTTLEFMGVILDTVRMEARVPGDKVEHIQAFLALYQTKKSSTLRNCNLLLGLWTLYAKFPPHPDPFCSVWLSSLAKSLNHTIILN